MEPGKKFASLSKRQQISASSKTVFLWVAGASIVAAFSFVAVIFLARQAFFNEKVLGAKMETADHVSKNITTAETLRQNVTLLLSNPALNATKTASDANNLQVVFDALPTSYDSANFGAGLQNVLLNGSVASIENLSVQSPDDSATGESAASSVVPGAVPMPFTMTFLGSADQVRASLENMERSVRPISITGLTVEAGNPLTVRLTGETYYYPAAELTLQPKTIKP